MVKVYFPSMFMRLVALRTAKQPPEAVLYVPKRMTKHEIREYLKKIYNIPVINISTANFLGGWSRIFGKRRIYSYKKRDYKKATVTYEDSDVKSILVNLKSNK